MRCTTFDVGRKLTLLGEWGVRNLETSLVCSVYALLDVYFLSKFSAPTTLESAESFRYSHVIHRPKSGETMRTSNVVGKWRNPWLKAVVPLTDTPARFLFTAKSSGVEIGKN